MTKKINKGFTFIELVIAMLISSFIMGGLVYVVSEANFYLQRQIYRDSVNKYANQVLNNMFKEAINAPQIEMANSNRIKFGYKSSNSENIDSMLTYEKRSNRGIFLNGEILKNATFYSKSQNEDFYMVIREFTGQKNIGVQGFNDNLRDAVIDILLGIELHYNRGGRKIVEDFSYKKTVFTRGAAVNSTMSQN